MAKTVILEFEDDDDVFALVESLNENRGIMVIDELSNMKRIYPEVSGVYKETYAIEGKEDKRFKVED